MRRRRFLEGRIGIAFSERDARLITSTCILDQTPRSRRQCQLKCQNWDRCVRHSDTYTRLSGLHFLVFLVIKHLRPLSQIDFGTKDASSHVAALRSGWAVGPKDKPAGMRSR
jgi:hypothetical protein